MKEYRSRWGMLTTDLNIKNRIVHIVFRSLKDGGSYYLTDDKDIIEALENDSCFNRNFYLFKEHKTVKIKAQEITASIIENNATAPTEQVDNEYEEIASDNPLEIVEEVTNVNEAREYLRKLGVDYRRLNTPNAILNQAAQANIQFPNLK